MRTGRHIIALAGILPLAACAVFGPVVDAGMTHAPYQACFNLVDMSPPDAPPQCVSVRVRPAGGDWQEFNGTLSAGDELLALPSAAPRCTRGNYTHVVLEGESASGALRIDVPDGFGRGDRGRSFVWHEPRTRWTADNIGATLHLPAGARVMVSEGAVLVNSLCFRSYTHYLVPGERRRPLL